MKLSVSTSMTNPQARGDCWNEAIQCYSELADEVIIMDGSTDEELYNPPKNTKVKRHKWSEEFNFKFIGQQFTRGYQACTGDWMIHLDIDCFIHETDMSLIRRLLDDNPNVPAMSFYKWQFVMPDRYNLKSRLVLAINKRLLGDRVKFDSGGDLCRPSIDGKQIDPNTTMETKIAIYNMEKLIKTENQIKNDSGRMERAYFRSFGKYQFKESDGSDESAYQGWLNMSLGRLNKPQQKVKLQEMPRYIQNTIKNLKPENWGYNGFGKLPRAYYND